MPLRALLAVLLQASRLLASCPPQCVCETRPWFTPQSVYHQARTVDCNDLLLTRVPADLASDTQVLLLQSNKISRLSGELQRLPNLTELDLSQNRLASVRHAGLANLSRLVTLYLEENQLEELPDGCLRGLTALEELYVNHNRLAAIAPSAFAGLASLLRLHLNANRLRAIDRRWFVPLPRLEILMIGENPIARLAAGSFQPLGRLHSLVLAGLGLRELPADAFQGLAELESLSLFENRLGQVPTAALSRLPLLKFLDLNKNPIGELRAGDFRGTPRLEELSLSGLEELTGVAEGAFDGLPQLAKLELNNNPRLSSLHPAALRGAPALRSLLAANGALGLLPEGLLASLPGLAMLSLHGNPLRCDCPAAWLGLARLALVEPRATLCAAPPDTAGRPLREGLAGSGGQGCPPAFPPQGWLEKLKVAAGESITLSCPASAEPPPEIYWLGPSGERLPSVRRGRQRAGGALELAGVGLADAGQYTCVAWNGAGSASRTLVLEVVGGGRWRERGPEVEAAGGGGGPGWGAGDGEGPALLVLVKKVQSHFVVVEWVGGEVLPWDPPGASPAPQASTPRWASATMHIHSPHLSYTAQVRPGSRQVNLTHLQPATRYEICLTVVAMATPAPATTASPLATAASSPATTASPLATAASSPVTATSTMATASSRARAPASLATASFPTATATSLATVSSMAAGESPRATASSIATTASSLATVSAVTKAASSRAPRDFSRASAPAPGTQRACLNVTTAGPAGHGVGGAALAAVSGSLLAGLCAVVLARYASRRLRELGCRHALKPCRQPPAALPLGEIYPPLISLGEAEGDPSPLPAPPASPYIDTSQTYAWQP
ncbi:leucine-rich repeat neuronal protein 1-like [Emydura macquarii macquarii]|uniref:leucine-rich repeat neuronal protein 1-like n=1 Tax=Emydura macquarii macquarii TaxID=1129001 RepID=UPI00352B2A8A